MTHQPRVFEAILCLMFAFVAPVAIAQTTQPSPSAKSNFREAESIRAILEHPAEEIDLARTKLAIDKMIDPTIDVEANLKKFDEMVARVRAMPGFGASTTSRLMALQRFIYEPGPWNDHRPFQYDLDDPLGKNITNKLLPTYLESMKGNCVTMPFLFIILGQRLGIDLTAATAPKHILVKWKNETGSWINLETTSGANPARDVWIRSQFPMTEEALANGVYLQPLGKKETAALMASTLAEHYFYQQQYEKAIAISDLILEHYPKDVLRMTLKAVAYGRLVQKHFMAKYPTPAQIPPDERGYFAYLDLNHRQWFAMAESLGWREERQEDDERYLQRIQRAREEKARR